MTERLLTRKDVRTKLGKCSDMHVWRLCNDPRYEHLAFPPPLRFDRRPRWRESDIDTFIERQSQLAQTSCRRTQIGNTNSENKGNDVTK